jgi:hypothetical protein
MVATLHLDWRTDGREQHRQWRWGGEAGADACTRVGAIRHRVPPADPESVLAVRVDLHDAAGGLVDTFRDQARVRT